MPQPYKVFIIYAREDAQYLNELRGQLRPLEHAGRLRVWSDSEIDPGVAWEQEIVHNLESADIILILVSAAYYNSAYIHDKEIKQALARHEKGEAKVLPVIVRPCAFLDDPVISRLQVLPTDGKAVNSQHWRDRDDAWVDVVEGVKRTLDAMKAAENRREQEKRATAERARREEEKRRRTARQAEENRRREAALQQAREEEDRRQKQQREAADAYQRADHAAWLQASGADNTEGYQNYLARFPQGDMVREAKTRIRALRSSNGPTLSTGRNMLISVGGLIVLLAFWLLPKMFEGENGIGEIAKDGTPTESSHDRSKSGFDLVRVEGGTFKMG
ncbi:MAG: TIR domain-containing protein, partial [Lewinellaceae bacterium]|nr:TIR domain-containing protein [Lewinellaceae bacterium]